MASWAFRMLRREMKEDSTATGWGRPTGSSQEKAQDSVSEASSRVLPSPRVSREPGGHPETKIQRPRGEELNSREKEGRGFPQTSRWRGSPLLSRVCGKGLPQGFRIRLRSLYGTTEVLAEPGHSRMVRIPLGPETLCDSPASSAETPPSRANRPALWNSARSPARRGKTGLSRKAN